MAKSGTSAFKTYVSELKTHFSTGEATEHTYRAALEGFIRSFGSEIRVTNEPGQKGKFKNPNARNKPDFVVTKARTPLGYVETKDVNIDLDEVADSNQIARYCEAYPNLIVTDYLEFRRYVKGKLRSQVRIGKATKADIAISDTDGRDLQTFFEEFLLEDAFSVSNSAELADRLASLTRQIRKLVKKELDAEDDSAHLHKLMIAFQKVLIADLDEDKFADMFAQTLAYGFFAARVHYDGKGEFSRRTASTILPKTNPFLRKLFREFADDNLPESLVGAVDDIVDLLKKTDIAKILEEFGTQGKNDAVIHFYESFLGAFDPELKKEMGVFYTPDPIVDYMVRSLDSLLVSKFDRKKGLADDKTLVLDPALGTGSFLHKVIETIHSRVQKGTWDSYVSEKLMDRIFGFEILMAPYAVAHLNLGIQLQKTGYTFERDQRLGVFLTNTLEETAKRSEVLFADWISEEANAAASIKRDRPIMVVVGNPPYSGISANKNPWIEGLLKGFDNLTNKKVASYFEVDGQPINEKKHWLNDDYVKFMRFAQWRIEQTGHGILGFITNHGFLDNPTFRGMRHAILKDFDEIYILDLHGNKKKKELSPDGKSDENVFDIQQGTNICFMVRHENRGKNVTTLAKVFRYDLWGSRKSKFDWLLKNGFDSTPFKEVKPITPFYTFTHQNHSLSKEYYTGTKITDIFPLNNSGMVTACDSLSIQFSKDSMWETIREFVDMTPSEAKEKWDLGGNRDWQIDWAQKDVRKSGLSKDRLQPITYRPFDTRWTYYTGNMKGFICNPRDAIMNHMVSGENIGLISARSNKSQTMDHFFVTNSLMETKAGESTTQSTLFPLFRFEEDAKGKLKKTLNLSDDAKKYIEDMCGDCNDETAMTFLNYCYACFHSPSFRTKYHDEIRQDYPRIQLTSDKSLFKKLAKYGQQLIDLHLLKDDRLDGGKTDYPVKGTNEISTVKFDAKNRRLYINKEQYFGNIPEEVFAHTIGGYQVLDKWLKYRRGHKLTFSDINQFEKIVEALVRTDEVVDSIESTIKDAGGWPLQTLSEGARKKAA